VSDRVFRTFDRRLMARARGLFAAPDARLLPVAAFVRAALGEPLTIAYKDAAGNSGMGATAFRAEAALGRPLTAETVKNQVGRLGGTDFCLEKLDLDLSGDLMVPLSEINAARRQAIAALRQNRLDAFLRREKIKDGSTPQIPVAIRRPFGKPLLNVHVGDIKGLCAALEGGADILVYGDGYSRRPADAGEYRQAARLAREKGKEIWFAAPRVALESDKGALLELIGIFAEIGCGVLASSLSAFAAAAGRGLPVWVNWTLNAFNSWALDFWRKEGAAGATLSPELTLKQVEGIAQKGILPIECMADGRAELMVSEYSAIDTLLGGAPPGAGQYFLRDRFGELFPVANDQWGRMRVLNAKELCLSEQVGLLAAAPVERLRLDARCLSAEEAGRRVALYREALDGQGGFAARPGTTRGHYFRGVL
jgi:putative protease